MKTRIDHIQFLNNLPLYHMLVKDLFHDQNEALLGNFASVKSLFFQPVDVGIFVRDYFKILTQATWSSEKCNTKPA